MENYHNEGLFVDTETLHTSFDSISFDFGLFDNFKQNGNVCPPPSSGTAELLNRVRFNLRITLTLSTINERKYLFDHTQIGT